MRNTLALDPGIQTIAAGDASQIRIAYFGTSELTLTAPFSGTVMAPSALLHLRNVGVDDDAFVGAFFAQSLDVQSNVKTQVVSRDVLLPILLYPITVPVMIAGVRGTAAIFQATPDEPLARFCVALLVFFDVVFVTLALWTFEPVMTD